MLSVSHPVDLSQTSQLLLCIFSLINCGQAPPIEKKAKPHTLFYEIQRSLKNTGKIAVVYSSLLLLYKSYWVFSAEILRPLCVSTEFLKGKFLEWLM